MAGLPVVMVVAAGIVMAAPVAARAAITPAPAVQIKAGHSNKCLNVDHALTADSTKIIQYDCSDAFVNDKFRLVPKGSNRFQIVAHFSGKCLNVQSGLDADGTSVIQYTCSDTGTNNLWQFAPVAGLTSVRVVSADSGKCLNVSGNSTANGAPLIIYTCRTAASLTNEQFYFPPATSVSRAALPAVPAAPVVGVQAGTATAAVGALVYGFVDTLGSVWRGYQSDPENFAGTVWQTVPGNERFTGHPSVTTQADGRAQISVRNATDGDLWLATQTAKDVNTWHNWWDAGGSSASQPVQGNLPDGKIVDFSLVNGELWHSPQDGVQAPYGGWRYIGGSGGIGEPAFAATRDGLRAFVLDGNGNLWTATYAGGLLSGFVSLGGSNLTGKPAVMVRPGFAVRIVMRAADGSIVTKAQRDDGTFEAAWTTIPGVTAAGAPAVLLEPATGRTGIVVRGTDNTIYYVAETGQNTGLWGAWVQAYPTTVVSDPTVLVYNRSTGRSWGYLVRDANNKAYVVTAETMPAGLAAAAAPAFSSHDLPPLPKR